MKTAVDGLRVSIEFSEVSSSQAAAVIGPKLVQSPYCDCTQQLSFPLAASGLTEPLMTLLMAG